NAHFVVYRYVKDPKTGQWQRRGKPIGAYDIETAEEVLFQAKGIYDPTPEQVLDFRAEVLDLARSGSTTRGDISYARATQPGRRPDIKEFGEEGYVTTTEARAAARALRSQQVGLRRPQVSEYPTLDVPRVGLGIEVQRGGAAQPPAPRERFRFPEEVEARFQASKTRSPWVVLGNLKDTVRRTRNIVTRTHEHLPRGAKYAEINEGLRRLSVNRPVAGADAAQRIQEIVLPFQGNPEKFDLFTRKVILDDLAEGTPSGRYPWEFTKAGVDSELVRLNRKLSQEHPDVLQQVLFRKEQWEKVVGPYIESMQAIGFDPAPRLHREHYFRHMILDQLENNAVVGTGRGLRTPTKRGFLEKRIGSAQDISSNYLEAEWQVMGQMIHDTAIARFLRQVERSKHNITGEVKMIAAQKNLKDWHAAVPEGYRTFQPEEANIFYMVDTIPQRLMQEAFAQGLTEVGVPKSAIGKALAMGEKKTELVLPEGLVLTLENYGKRTKGSPGLGHAMERAGFKGLRAWKQYQLINPKRLVNYNLRNWTGDIEAVLRGNPASLRQVPTAVRQLWQNFSSTAPATGDLKLWRDRGGTQGLLQAQEMGDINELSRLLRIVEQPAWHQRPAAAWQWYWRKARLATDFRESILRYATFLDYLAQVRADVRGGGGGRPKNFGASIREEVMALPDPVDRAFKLSNELLGAYDSVSAFGQWMRKYMIPFWSWQEVNIGRESRLFRNALRSRGAGGAAASGLIGAGFRTARLTAGATKYLLGMAAALGAAQVYNMTVWPEVEAVLPNEAKARPHIIMPGSTPEHPRVLWRVGAVTDFLEWFGLEDAPNDVRMVLNGHKSLREWAEQTAVAPVSKMLSTLGPQHSTFHEAISGTAMWPEPFERRRIRDVPPYIARGLALEPEVVALTGRPQREPYLKSLAQVVGNPVDAEESAYWELFEYKRRFQERVLGIEASSMGGDTTKGKALYQLKRALRFGDEAGIEKYAKMYADRGGTKRGLQLSVKDTQLYSGIPRNEQARFRRWLGEGWEAKLSAAESFQRRIAANAAKAYPYLPARAKPQAGELAEALGR
ncbi:MAG TPA: hypothetical protein VM389_00530, partial [Phycisphaerae bacterium]|nr:hypothetical protein [Phycisphaerae bacterium]